MKLFTKRTTALLALAGMAVFAGSAKAGGTFPGDLLLGFEQSGVTHNILVDIGPFSTYVNATPGSSFTVQFGVIPGTSTAVTSIGPDLSSIFGSSWASNTGTGLVQWGIVGASDPNVSGTYGGVSLAADSIFLTKAETTPGTQSSAFARKSSGFQANVLSNIYSLETGAYGFNSPSASSTNSTVVAIQDTTVTGAQYWSLFNPGTTGFGYGKDIEQAASGTNIGPTNSALDLYELQPGTGNGTFLGDFTLNSNGNLTFTAAVPEPSTYASLGLGFAVMLIVQRRRRRLAHA